MHCFDVVVPVHVHARRNYSAYFLTYRFGVHAAYGSHASWCGHVMLDFSSVKVERSTLYWGGWLGPSIGSMLEWILQVAKVAEFHWPGMNKEEPEPPSPKTSAHFNWSKFEVTGSFINYCGTSLQVGIRSEHASGAMHKALALQTSSISMRMLGGATKNSHMLNSYRIDSQNETFAAWLEKQFFLYDRCACSPCFHQKSFW